MALIQPLAWEIPCATGAVIKKKKSHNIIKMAKIILKAARGKTKS